MCSINSKELEIPPINSVTERVNVPLGSVDHLKVYKTDRQKKPSFHNEKVEIKSHFDKILKKKYKN